jgi:hypothetical protein
MGAVTGSTRWIQPGTEHLRPKRGEEERLRSRLEALGVRAIARLRLTDNRSVMVSFSRRRELSVHRGYADAPDGVLRAIIRFVAPGTPRTQRNAARREIVAFHATLGLSPGSPRRRERPSPADAPMIARLEELFAAHNARHFGGRLVPPPIRLSARMRSRLGHLALDQGGQPTEITISRRHVAQHDWPEVEETLLHEMVHLWQHANGHPVNHGPAFRAKAREVGAHAAARRWVRRTPRARRGTATP